MKITTLFIFIILVSIWILLANLTIKAYEYKSIVDLQLDRAERLMRLELGRPKYWDDNATEIKYQLKEELCQT